MLATPIEADENRSDDFKWLQRYKSNAAVLIGMVHSRPFVDDHFNNSKGTDAQMTEIKNQAIECEPLGWFFICERYLKIGIDTKVCTIRSRMVLPAGKNKPKQPSPEQLLLERTNHIDKNAIATAKAGK